MQLDNIKSLERVGEYDFKAKSKDFIEVLEKSELEISGLEVLKRDIDYIMNKDYVFGLWVEDGIIKFEW